jgi:hypothetical protein
LVIVIVIPLKTSLYLIGDIANDAFLIDISELACDSAGNKACALVDYIMLVADYPSRAGDLSVYSDLVKEPQLMYVPLAALHYNREEPVLYDHRKEAVYLEEVPQSCLCVLKVYGIVDMAEGIQLIASYGKSV